VYVEVLFSQVDVGVPMDVQVLRRVSAPTLASCVSSGALAALLQLVDQLELSEDVGHELGEAGADARALLFELEVEAGIDEFVLKSGHQSFRASVETRD